MEIKTYGIYDTVAKTLINTFTSQNDETCQRACVAICKDPKTDRNTIKDCVVRYLYSVDNETGLIVNIEQHGICLFSTILEEVGPVSVDEKNLQEVKDMVLAVKQSYSAYGDAVKTLDKANGVILERLAALESKVDKIIKGEIKCKRKLFKK